MIRTQVQLTEGRHRRLRRIAADEGVSMAEIVRRALENALAQRDRSLEDRYRAAADLVGRFRDREDAADLSSNHDRYLEDAFGCPGWRHHPWTNVNASASKEFWRAAFWLHLWLISRQGVLSGAPAAYPPRS